MNAGQRPREARHKVVIPTHMRAGGAKTDVCIRNVSSRGLMLQAACPPPAGTYVEIFQPAHMIVARVVWCKDKRFGVRTSDVMDIKALISGTVPQRRAADRNGHMPQSLSQGSPRRRASDIAEQHERSRRLSRAFEFALIGAFGVIAAGLVGGVVYENMTRPIERIASHLV